jgi:chemotaxis protein methyltransferase CheR
MLDDTATPQLTQRDFQQIQQFIYNYCGINLTDSKQSLVASRLHRRVQHYKLSSYGAYFDLATRADNGPELTLFVNSLTTNETYFFREIDHFDFLTELLKNNRAKPAWRFWSGASSSGEEIYSRAMGASDILSDQGDWLGHGSDLSTKVIEMARAGHYPLERNEGISLARLKKYCLKGVGPQAGTFMIDPKLRAHTQFSQRNLMQPDPRKTQYDIIFLRNVMIYFNQQSKQQVINNVLQQLRSGGYLFISHTESLMGIQHGLQSINSSIYRKP